MNKELNPNRLHLFYIFIEIHIVVFTIKDYL